MDEHIEQIAKENIRNRKIMTYVAVLSVMLFCIFFAYSVETNFQNIISVVAFVLFPILGLFVIKNYQKKIIGKKTALDHEIERLKSLIPKENLELPQLDESELKLKESIRSLYRDES